MIALVSVLVTLHAAYDPLAASGAVKTRDLTFKDSARSRDVPIRLYLPEGDGKHPVVMFSHGLGGSRENNRYLGNHFAKRGYLVVYLQHPGSDSGVWRGVPVGQRMNAMKAAAGGQNLILRAQDVQFVMDELPRNPATKDRADMTRVGMSGHSFGAYTTQVIAGQSTPLTGPRFKDSRVKAAIMYSPSSARRGADNKAAFGEIEIPCLLMTGTLDDSPIGEQSPESRRLVFPALKPGSKYELVLDGARHSAFNDGNRLEGQKNPNHHRAILALSTAFWDAYLRGDTAARAWLDGAGAKSVLETKDVWQLK